MNDRFLQYSARILLRGAFLSALLPLSLFMLLSPSAAADPESPALLLNHTTFAPTEGAWWKLVDMDDEIHFMLNDVYIQAPTPAQDREHWVQALHEFRSERRSGSAKPGAGRFRELIALDFGGKDTRAWVRVTDPIAKAYALKSGEKVKVSVEARWLRGVDQLCVAVDYVTSQPPKLDYYSSEADKLKWLGWSNVLKTIEIPKDRQWHTITTEIEVPAFTSSTAVIKPMLGLDGSSVEKPGYIELRSLQFQIEDPARMQSVHELSNIPGKPLDQATYEHPGRQWMKNGFTCHFTFMYDLSFYDYQKGGYQLDSFLNDGKKQFGGYDILLLWHAYPRIGLDPRNQLDFYRDMPGGLSGVRELVDAAHSRGVKVFINYNPWDISTNRTGKSDEEMLADLVASINVDGIFLDTMSGDSPKLRNALETVRPGIALAPENNLSIDSLSICSGSWAQWLGDSENPPGLELRKWLEPRHMRWQIARNNYTHRDEIRRAFFNGSGMMVWENVFGVWNRWTGNDRKNWRRAANILHQYHENFSSDDLDPFYPALYTGDDIYNFKGLSINRWPGGKGTVYTIYKKEDPPPTFSWYGQSFWYKATEIPLFEAPTETGVQYFDLWNGRPARVESKGNKTVVYGFPDRLSGLACIGAVPTQARDADFEKFLSNQKQEADSIPTADDLRGTITSPMEVHASGPSALGAVGHPAAGMVDVPAATIPMRITHQRRECGCYPDPGTPADQWEKFTWGTPHNGMITHDYTVDVAPFQIDEAAVTNAVFKRFLEESGYQPREATNFLKHWPNGKMPAELADHPVVYVDLNDARAYAQWAGKRLPTEAEWQLAAQGTDGRKWPWGGEMDPKHPDAERVNTTGHTLPVRDLPDSRSPFGCYQMAGNVYEWTDSERSDGHTRFCIIRGGSYYNALGSDWYMDGGPRPCDHHAKFIMMWPGLDRCATIGFRCVKDVK